MTEHVFPTSFKLPVGFAREQIVRCKDCRWYDKTSFGGVCYLPDGDGDYKRWSMNPMGFCSDGESTLKDEGEL